VTPTFARSILMPRLRGFIDAYPEIDLTLQVSIPLLDVVAEDADLMIRFGTGRYADVEHVCLMTDEVTPLASPALPARARPFRNGIEDLLAAKPDPQPAGALAHLVPGPRRRRARAGRRLVVQRHRPDVRRRGAGPGHCARAPQARCSPGWTTARWSAVSPRNVPSPHAHYLCWRTGTMDRWECAAFADWLKKSLA
jgi:LysR family glycine cleavage system transcriptional activator